MGKKIRVTPQELELASSKLGTLAESYNGIYTNLMQAASTMGEAWEGQDNLDFVNQITGFTKELDAMAAKLETASRALKQQKDNYVTVQDANSMNVKKLKN